jgi:hypothetical protein
MNNYLLTVIGSFESEELCKDIALSITPIVDSPNLKFQHAKGVLIFHFASEVSQEEIYDYISGILFGITESFILTEMTDKVSVSMPKDIKEHLFDLEGSTGDVELRLDMNRVKNNMDFSEEEEEDFVALLLEEMKDKKIFKKPSLDQILDKMLNEGSESLTRFEKDILDNYSKN